MLAILAVGDDAAQEFEELVEKYERRVFNLILRLVGDYDEAADLTQDTFLAAYKAFNGFRSQSSPYTWLYRIAINVCKNRFREKERRRSIETEPLADSLDETAAEAALSARMPSPEAAIQQKELRALVEKAIRELPEDYRVVIVLREMHRLTYQEIAEAADISIDLVKTRLARARSMLRQKLEPYINQNG